jgi:uncharacterized protein YpmS
MSKKEGGRMKNWKTAFLILAGINLVFLMGLVVVWNMLTTAPDHLPPSSQAKLPTSPVFTVNADKNQITKLINAEITKHPRANLTYHVDMTKTLDIIGDLKLFGLGIPFTMSFNPTVDDKGNIILKEKGVKLGRFRLPESQVLKFVKAGTDLPSWVYVNPDKKEIYIDLNNILIKDRFYFKAKEIDLPNNKLIFNVYRKPDVKTSVVK